MSEKLMNVRDAAKALSIRESTVRAWLLARRIGHVRVGRRAIRIPESEIQRLIAEGTVPAAVRR